MPHPERVNKQEVPAALPHGTGKGTVVDGGLARQRFAGFVHSAAEGVEFSASEAAAHAEAEAALAEEIDHDGALGGTQPVVPGEDDGGRAEVDVRAALTGEGHLKADVHWVRSVGVFAEYGSMVGA